MKIRKAMTLLELLIVMVIVATLSLIAIPNFTGSRASALQAKARHALVLIAQAQKIVDIEAGAYIPFTANDKVNAKIGTDVSGIDLGALDHDPDFEYSFVSPDAQADVKGGGGSCFTYNIDTGVFGDFTCQWN